MPRLIALTASPENMRRVDDPRVFAFDRESGERFSATAGDYWQHADRQPLTDATGPALVLMRERCQLVPAEVSADAR